MTFMGRVMSGADRESTRSSPPPFDPWSPRSGSIKDELNPRLQSHRLLSVSPDVATEPREDATPDRMTNFLQTIRAPLTRNLS